jgi:hypothetical protein
MALAEIFAASISGATIISALPATGESIFLILAASLLTALSKAKGPSTTPPFISCRSAIFAIIAASMVAGILGFGTSSAHVSATFGLSTPSFM